MLQDILLKIGGWLKESKILEENKVGKLMDLLKWYKVGDWVYPGIVVRKLEVTADKAYDILELLKDKGILKVNFEVYCHKCNQFSAGIYETLVEIPENQICEECNAELTLDNNTIVIYKVIEDDTK